VAVYGLAFGVLATQANMDELEVGIMGATVFAGAAQILAVERLVAGAGAIAALVAAVAINLRLLLVTASIREVFANRPLWQRLLGAHMSTDENWALMLATRADGRAVGYWYLVGGGACLLLTWLCSTVAAAMFAAAIPSPAALGMDFAFTAAFIAVARSLWRGFDDLLPWVCSVVLVIVLTRGGFLDSAWALVAGGIGGSVIAALYGGNANPDKRPNPDQRRPESATEQNNE
jgi:predicted branched-subunit amino acid permease